MIPIRRVLSLRGLANCPNPGSPYVKAEFVHGFVHGGKRTAGRWTESRREKAKQDPGRAARVSTRRRGCDIGAREIFVAVPPDRDENPVRKCGTFTWQLNAMAEWMASCGIKTVAMESTGVYWIPVYDVFEKHGLQVQLVNPRNMKNVPGKRTASALTKS